jgi:predicted Na+-dependent transporter
MKIFRICLMVFLGLFALPIVFRLVVIAVAFVRDMQNGANHASELIGAFVGTLIVCVLIGWLISYLLKLNRATPTASNEPKIDV